MPSCPEIRVSAGRVLTQERAPCPPATFFRPAYVSTMGELVLRFSLPADKDGRASYARLRLRSTI